MPEPAVSLRPARVDDAGEVLVLQRAAWLSEGRRHGTFDIPPLTETLAEVREALRTWTAFVAVDAHRVVGTVRATTVRDDWYVGRLGVVPDRHGEGIGDLLLRAAEAAAPASTRRAVLTTGPKSVDNIAFYERRGYRRLPEDDPAVHPELAFLVHLAKPLEHAA